jgi:signal transduction histidine kinase
VVCSSSFVWSGQPRKKIRLNFYALKATYIAILFLLFAIRSSAQDNKTPPITLDGFTKELVVTDPVTCFIDSGKLLSSSQVASSTFNISYSSFTEQLRNNHLHRVFWLQFGIRNVTDTVQRIYLYCGDINFIRAYLHSPGHSPQLATSGTLVPKHDPSDFNDLPILPLTLDPKESANILISLEQRTQEFEFAGITLYDLPSLSSSLFTGYRNDRVFVFFELLFQGFLLCQILYVFFQWIIIKKKEYLYYFFYLSIISLYFLSKYESIYGVRLLFSRYPMLSVYLSKTLLILPYFLYFRFVRSFLEMPENYPLLNKWIKRIERFLLAYLVFDLVFIITTLNQEKQLEVYTIVFSLLFITVASFIVYMFRQKKILINYILTGSLFVGIGNILGLIFTYLDNNLHFDLGFHNMLIFSQIGIVLEIICFTAGLSYKSKSAEEDKIKSQQNLIEQLKANEALESRMQHIRNKIAQDLHDDIGSTLSSISILSDLAAKENDIVQTNETMNEIKKSSITLMEKMDDIVWSINPKNDSFDNLLMRVKRFATTLFEARDIDYSIEISDNIGEIKLPMDARQHIYLILKEAINNLIKYAGATKAGISVRVKDRLLELRVWDNGKGFAAQTSFTGNGILNMKSRALSMNADLTILSAPQKGTDIVLTIMI